VAGEDCGGEIGKRRALRMHWHGVISVLAWKAATNPSTGWVADRVAFEVGTLPGQNGSRKARATRPAIMQNLRHKSATVLWGAHEHCFDLFRLRLRAADLAATEQSLSVRHSRRQVYSGDACCRNRGFFRRAVSVGISCFCTGCRDTAPEACFFVYLFESSD